MKIYQLLFIMIFALTTSCKSDQALAEGEPITEENVENLAEDLLAEEMASIEELDESAVEEGTVTNEVEVELDEVIVDQEKVKEQKKEILKE